MHRVGARGPHHAADPVEKSNLQQNSRSAIIAGIVGGARVIVTMAIIMEDNDDLIGSFGLPARSRSPPPIAIVVPCTLHGNCGIDNPMVMLQIPTTN